MARSWKISIEVGGSDGPTREIEVGEAKQGPASSQTPTVSLDARHEVWETLKDARHKLAKAMASGDQKLVGEINNWIGGGLVALATLTGENAERLRDSLVQAVPVSSVVNVATDKVPTTTGDQPYFRVMTDYVPPPRTPGAPKPLDPSTLTEEEREAIGMIIRTEGEKLGLEAQVAEGS